MVFVLMSLCITGVINKLNKKTNQGLPNKAPKLIEKPDQYVLERDDDKRKQIERYKLKMIQEQILEIMRNILKRFDWNRNRGEKYDRDRVQVVRKSIERITQQPQNSVFVLGLLGLLLSGITYLLISMSNLFNLCSFWW